MGRSPRSSTDGQASTDETGEEVCQSAISMELTNSIIACNVDAGDSKNINESIFANFIAKPADCQHKSDAGLSDTTAYTDKGHRL